MNQSFLTCTGGALALLAAPLHPAAASSGAEEFPAPTVFEHCVIDEAGPLSIWGKAAADLNGDRRPDLVVGGFRGGGLVWYENPGWAKHPIDTQTKIGTDVEVVDMNRDGKPDIVAIAGAGIGWYRGPDWKFQIVASDRVHDIEVADFDHDGDLDIVARNQNLGQVSGGATLFAYRQDAHDKWVRFTFPIVDGEGLKAVDIDRDGDLDLALNGTWLENRRDLGAPWPAHLFAADWKQDKVFVAAADLNSDGRTDLVMSPSEPKGRMYRLSWFEAPAEPKAGAWQEHVVETEIESVQHFVGVADFNLDGQPDIATAAMLQGAAPQNVSIYLNHGRGRAWTRKVIATTGSHGMQIVDLDGTGTPSLFGANHQSSKVELWRNTTKRTRRRRAACRRQCS